MQASLRQQAVYNSWQNEDKNLLIQAVAGSGKTTTLLELIKKTSGQVLYLAFNKSIQVETATKFEEKSITNGKALTIHSLGLQSIRMSRIKFSIKNSKFYHLFKELKEKHGRILNSCVKEVAEKGTERADEAVYMTLKDMNEYSRLFLTTKYSDIINILLDMDKFPVDNKHLEILWKHFVNVRMESYNKPVVDIDFTDMIYIPLKFNLYIPVAEEYLMIDECQDLNLAQHKFIDKINSQGTVKKWVACGDRNQSIYGFSGAYPESFDLFTKKPNVRELPLDINYRCAVNIVKQSNNVYDIMTPFKSHNGRVANYTLGTVSSSDGLDDNQDNFFKTEFKDKNTFKDILIICRNKRPLFSMYFFLLERNIPAFIMGEDILNGVIRMLKPYGDTPIETIENIFEREIEDFEINIKDDKDRAKLFYMKENLANFNIVSRKLCSPFDRGSDLLESFKKLFEDKTNAVTLCSIHKSKGLESEKVIILNESLIPSPFAKKPAQITQEINLKYVARTRAKEELIYLEADFTNF